MKTVLVSSARVNALLGLSLPAEDMVAILKRIGATVKQVDAATLSCMGPFERTDLNLEEDYIAEIGRVYGYQHVVSVVPPAVPLKEINARHYYSEVVRETLLVHGFGEVITSSFRKKDDVKLLSSLASDKGYLRSSLMPGMHEALDKNASFVDLLGATDTRMCEIGTVFHKAEGTVQEHVALCFGVRLKQTGYSGKEDAIVASIVLALEAALGTNLVFTTTKGVAEINFSEVIARLPVPASYQPVVKTKDVAYQAFSMYPAVTRDIAMWVGEGTEVAAVVSVLDAAAGPLRVRTTHVDAFTKDGRTSLAFRLVFQAHDRTLTDEAVNSVMEQVYAAATNVGWQTR
jgi:phenylalanyl-tRNA synthetase beta chain